MKTYSLDADILTKLLKKHPGNRAVFDRFRAELFRNSTFILCPVAYQEIRRELEFKQARAPLPAFEQRTEAMHWRELEAAVWRRAAGLWWEPRRGGKSHHGADVLIAAHAVEYGARMVTGNVAHFQHGGVRLENWNEKPRGAAAVSPREPQNDRMEPACYDSRENDQGGV